ncbi:MAG: hypothetical protein HXY42_04770 [Chloroflexi bacterium]|mgnify:CR=1 FL=1|nr:hypothetical protein [Chloroflexota bacterium]
MQIPFDGLLTLLIFLVGIPALILQLISSTERRAVLKNGRLDVRNFLRRALWIIGIGIVAEILFVNLLRLEPTLQDTVSQLIWVIVFGSLFYLAWVISQQIPEQYGRREKIVERLTRDVLTESQKRMRVSGGTFTDLASLGKHCEAGQEREMVITAFMKIVKDVLSDPRYKGDSFEALIEELVHMLGSNPEAKDLYNYKIAEEILSAILAANSSTEADDDDRRAVHAISRLGRTLIVNFQSVEGDNVILSYVDALEFALARPHMLTEVSQALFEIGICAAQAGHDFVAVAALDKLTSLALRQPAPLPVEFVADLFGLLAHYRAKKNSRMAYANRKFAETKRFLGKNPVRELREAQNHLVKTLYFDQADQLGELIADIKPKAAPRPKKK